MAIRKGNFFTGAVGPIIYRTYRGQQIMSGKARTNYKIADGTMKNANTFGKASTFACQIRDSLKIIITANYDGTMPGRLIQEVVYSLKNGCDRDTGEFYFDPSSFDALAGFQFNSVSPFNRSLLVEPYITVTDNQLTLHLPEINVPKQLKFPADANSCTINFMLMELNLLEGTKRMALVGTTTIENKINSFNAAQEWTAPLQEGWFSVLAISLNYVQHTYAGNVVLNNKKLCPAMIIKAGFITNINQAGPFTLDPRTYKKARNKKNAVL
jgi:hypothetical protein